EFHDGGVQRARALAQIGLGQRIEPCLQRIAVRRELLRRGEILRWQMQFGGKGGGHRQYGSLSHCRLGCGWDCSGRRMHAFFDAGSVLHERAVDFELQPAPSSEYSSSGLWRRKPPSHAHSMGVVCYPNVPMRSPMCSSAPGTSFSLQRTTSRPVSTTTVEPSLKRPISAPFASAMTSWRS